MDATEKAVLSVVKNSPDQTLQGRTLLQKAIYFLNEMLDLGIGYRPHYFGPFSEDVATTTASLVARGALREIVECLPTMDDQFDACRYTYQLTELGDLMLKQEPHPGMETACTEILGVTRDYTELAAAAKLHHIVVSHGDGLRYEIIMSEARELGWKLDRVQVENAARLLLRLLGAGVRKTTV